MTEDKIELNDDEFVISKDDEGGKEEKHDLLSMLVDAEKTMKEMSHALTQLDVLGITERIYYEDRDAHALFRNKEGRCDIHGIKCSTPCCNTCEFADMQSRKVCAIMDNLNSLYGARKDWRQNDDKDGDGVENGIPQGFCPDIDEL